MRKGTISTKAYWTVIAIIAMLLMRSCTLDLMHNMKVGRPDEICKRVSPPTWCFYKPFEPTK